MIGAIQLKDVVIFALVSSKVGPEGLLTNQADLENTFGRNLISPLCCFLLSNYSNFWAIFSYLAHLVSEIHLQEPMLLEPP